jgi:GH25 family lysozyme M1 (1,4-beta-N-acetylmuramidase)
MPVLSRGWRTHVGGRLVLLWLSGLLLASLGVAPAAAATGGGPGGRAPDRSNVGAPHSPQLLRQLAGPPAGPSLGPTRPPAGPPGRINGDEQGVDVASFQHPAGAAINWPRVHSAGIRFAGVKATEGAYYRNPYALSDLAQARAARVSAIAYAFAIPNGNGGSSRPVTQADYIVQYLGSLSRTVPIALDIEYNPYGRECYGLTARAMVSWISAFAAEIRARTGRAPIVYTPPSWWASCTGGSTAFGQATQLWVPDYTSSGHPWLPAGWTTWSLWQYTSSGTVAGIADPGHTDLDQANPASSGGPDRAGPGRR